MNTFYNDGPHAFQLTGHDTPVLSPDRVSLELVPFDRSPSFHPFRDGWLSRLVRRLRGYYGSVRLPMFVHRQITSGDLLTRSARPLADQHRLSRFSRKLFLYMLRFFDRAGLGSFGTSDMAFHYLLTVSARGSRSFAARWLACTCLCQRFQVGLTANRTRRKVGYGSLSLYRITLSFTTTCRFSPALSGDLNL
jgi:hypothetical protein